MYTGHEKKAGSKKIAHDLGPVKKDRITVDSNPICLVFLCVAFVLFKNYYKSSNIDRLKKVSCLHPLTSGGEGHASHRLGGGDG